MPTCTPFCLTVEKSVVYWDALNKLRRSLQQNKRRGMLSEGFVLLYVNLQPHTGACIKASRQKLNREIVDPSSHPPTQTYTPTHTHTEPGLSSDRSPSLQQVQGLADFSQLRNQRGAHDWSKQLAGDHGNDVLWREITKARITEHFS